MSNIYARWFCIVAGSNVHLLKFSVLQTILFVVVLAILMIEEVCIVFCCFNVVSFYFKKLHASFRAFSFLEIPGINYEWQSRHFQHHLTHPICNLLNKFGTDWLLLQSVCTLFLIYRRPITFNMAKMSRMNQIYYSIDLIICLGQRWECLQS